MRGGDERSGSLFSYVDLEARVGKDHPLRTIRGDCERGACRRLSGEFSALYSRMRPALDPAGEAAAGDAVAGVLFDPLGAAVDGAAGVRPAVSLVRRPRRRRCGVGSLDVFQEPRAPAGGRHRGQVLERGAGAAAGEAAAQHGSFLGRRHADRGLGVDEELQAEGRLGRTVRRRAAGGTARRTSTARSARTRRTPRRPIPRRGSIARGRARRPSSASWAMP